MQKKKKIILYFVATPLSLFVMFLTFMTIFEYTTVADIRESLAGVDKQETLAYGKVLFDTRGCSSCHAIESDQESLGPNLSGLSQRSSVEYIRQSIVSPGAVVVEGYSDVTMPNFGEILDHGQVEALVEYILNLK